MDHKQSAKLATLNWGYASKFHSLLSPQYTKFCKNKYILLMPDTQWIGNVALNMDWLKMLKDIQCCQFCSLYALLVYNSQCGKFRIFLSLRFYVKSVPKDLKVVKMSFMQFQCLCLNFGFWISFSFQKIIKIKIQNF